MDLLLGTILALIIIITFTVLIGILIDLMPGPNIGPTCPRPNLEDMSDGMKLMMKNYLNHYQKLPRQTTPKSNLDQNKLDEKKLKEFQTINQDGGGI